MDANSRQDLRRLRVLRVLAEASNPIASTVIAEQLELAGEALSERTIRNYLQSLDRDGLTQYLPRRGRLITERGRRELASSRTLERVGFLSARIDRMSYAMTFNARERSGTVVVNTTVARSDDLKQYLDEMLAVFEKGYAMGRMVGLLQPGECLGDFRVPEGRVGLCTVCSITINGVLLKHGIPTFSRFGGLLELRQGRPVRFAEIITYDGTSIDPLEIFIRSGMTNYVGAVTCGDGLIGASFREIPSESRESTQELAAVLDDAGLGAFLAIGMGGQSLLGIPVMEGRAGAIVIGGLNPVAILEEHGIRAPSGALAGLLDYGRLFEYHELAERLDAMG